VLVDELARVVVAVEHYRVQLRPGLHVARVCGCVCIYM
jgi:hypothetical protein